MARDLPSLNALRAFEAAARHLSFTRAADELNVTQAAVSHQVKALEERLGVRLFRRLNRRLMLTDAGQMLQPPLGEALDRMADAVARLKHEDKGVLTITTMESFAASWLVPRLARFRRRNPDIDVRLMLSDEPVDLPREGIDAGIRYGRGSWPRAVVERLMTEELFPVCAPALLRGGRTLERPRDLAHFTLLHDDMRQDWVMWLMAAGVDGIDATRGPAFQHSNLVVQAAMAGQGVALGRSVRVADALADGRLVKPFDIALPSDYAYYLALAEGGEGRPKVRAFRDWLMEEAQRSQAEWGLVGTERYEGAAP